jgi:spermidine synthase
VTRPWRVLDRVTTAEGTLELRQRGERDFLITVGGRVLMASAAHRSEDALARQGCARVAARPRPRLLLGGLGMGFTLRAALDVLPRDATIEVVELTPAVVDWCRGPLAPLTGRAVDEPRVTVAIGDVAARIAATAKAGSPRYDAILLDLYEGPREPGGETDPFYGRGALEATRAALAPGGTLGVWGEDPDGAFERRLETVGFTWKRLRPPGGPRHVVWLATADRPAATRRGDGTRRRDRPK